MSKTPKLYLEDKDIHQATEKLLKKIKKLKLKGKTAIIAVARGGLVPAQYLGYALGIRDVYAVSSRVYNGQEKGNSQEISNIFMIDFEEFDNFLIVDDMYDSGITMEGLLFAMEQVMENFDTEARLVPAVLYSHLKKKKSKEIGIVCGQSIEKIKGKSPWVVFPWDKYEALAEGSK